jgi:serine/threonine protein kinase
MGGLCSKPPASSKAGAPPHSTHSSHSSHSNAGKEKEKAHVPAKGKPGVVAKEGAGHGIRRPVRALTKESVVLERFKVGGKIGTGTFATVHECVDRESKAKRAIKIIDKHQQKGRFLASFHREMDILQVVNHPYIIRLIEAFETADKIYLVTDLLTGGDLLQFLLTHKYMTETETKCVIQKIIWAVDYLHQADILHRDIKPENILLGSQGLLNVKLCDFGHSALAENKADGFGTYDYLAPELIANDMASPASDMWSVGAVTYVMLSGAFPFDSHDEQKMYREILAGDYKFEGPIWAKVSAEAKDFISRLMTVDVKKRATVSQALRHPWIADYQDEMLWEDVEARSDSFGASASPRRGGGGRKGSVSGSVTGSAYSNDYEEEEEGGYGGSYVEASY